MLKSDGLFVAFDMLKSCLLINNFDRLVKGKRYW